VAGESKVDIKDFILIGGGLLIASVVAHGFWIAWRDRRQDFRIDIKPDLIPDEMDEMDRLRGELPNGPSRVMDVPDPLQDSLELDEPPPLLLEPTEAPPVLKRIEPAMGSGGIAKDDSVGRPRPSVEQEPDQARDRAAGRARLPADDAGVAELKAASRQSDGRARVADVSLPEPIGADEPKQPRRLGQRRSEETPDVAPAPPVEELVVLNLLADSMNPYAGDALFAALRTCGLKFGDMNIFHRVEPLTKAVQYSVANAVEPGTFDMAEMEAIRCPGLCLFMQLPGPEEPSAAFEDMLSVARSITRSLGGEMKDEHRNLMTPQTVEHYRQRIVDFSRRRMSKRA